MIKVSIITPCYNDGEFLLDAIESTRSLVESGFCEHILVDDCSTDKQTKKVYEKLRDQNVQIIYAKKVGLSAARNIGIEAASADYYLNLDADNKIRQEYPVKAAKILDENPHVGVVYSNYKYFGIHDNIIKCGVFNPYRLLHSNYIDTCSVIRKQAWKDLGGYDEKESFWEDWNFWIGMLNTPWKFYYLDEVMFDYRIRKKGNLRAKLQTRENEVRGYIAGKYGAIYQKYHCELWEKVRHLDDIEHIKKLEDDISKLKSVLADAEQSISWKITKPLRILKSILKSKKS